MERQTKFNLALYFTFTIGGLVIGYLFGLLIFGQESAKTFSILFGLCGLASVGFSTTLTGREE